MGRVTRKVSFPPSGSPSYSPNNLPVYRGGDTGVAPDFDPTTAFQSGAYVGFLYDPRVVAGLFQLSNGTTAVTTSDPVGYITDDSGSGNHALQSTSGSRPIYPGLDYDGVDDGFWVIEDAAGGHDFVDFGDASNPVSFMCRVNAANASATAAGTLAASLGAAIVQLRRRQGSGYTSPFTFGFDANKLHFGVTNNGGTASTDKSVASTGTIANSTDTTVGFTMSYALPGVSEITYSLYIGGVLDSAGVISLANANAPNVGVSPSDLTIGFRTNSTGVPSNHLDGTIGPAILINRTLTADDFAEYHTWAMA